MLPSESRPLSADQLAEHARRVAETHASTATSSGQAFRPLVKRIESSRDDLDRVYEFLAETARRGETVLPAGEWILDNYYIVREQFLRIREHLTKGFYRKLPKIVEGPLQGVPRVFEIVRELADNTDNIIDDAGLVGFVNAYQDIVILQLGELWAVPIMVRIVMLERLESLSREILEAHEISVAAEKASARILEQGDMGKPDPAAASQALTDNPLDDLRRSPHFSRDLMPALVARTVEIARGLTNEERAWFEREFESRETTAERVLDGDTRRQSERQVSVSNAIISLRNATDTDWSRLVESLSVVEQALRLDPAGVYPEMDFKSRDRYRGRIEHLAEHSDLTEFEVARRLLELSEIGGGQGDLPQEKHVGWMLVDECRDVLEREIGYRMPLRVRLRRWVDDHPATVFFGPGILLFVATTGLPVWLAANAGLSMWLVVLAGAAALLPSWDLSLALMNWLVSMTIPPRVLSRMSYEEGIPDAHRAIVVVPTQITSVEHARQQIEQLEIRAIANQDPNLRYALLTAFGDAPEAEMPGDAEIISTAVAGIRTLNERHNRTGGDGRGDGSGDTFFLLHRERRWNPLEGVWMEWERKRGKLEEFNRLLGDPDAETTFTVIEGDLAAFVASGAVPYVITLDADTQLPSDAARDLVRIAAHPFNVPVLESEGSDAVVRRGYAVLQPRISILPEEAGRSSFARLFSGNVGLDPYTTAVSDTYQDLFGEGIYTGKGLYHADLFRKLLGDAFPENAVLSHDLLEGSIARTALVTDVELFDSYPSTYTAYARRMHRWIRGDWQLLPWIFGRGERRIPALGRWKMLENLRRSLSMPAILVFFLVGWIALPGLAARWTLLGLVLLSLPVLLGATTVLLTRPTSGPGRKKLSYFWRDMLMDVSRAGLTITVLPDAVRVSLDAVGRTIWRFAVSKRRMLEWRTAYEVEMGGQEGILQEYSRMWPNPAAGILLFAEIVGPWPLIPPVAFPFVIIWVLGPILTWFLGRERLPAPVELSPDDEMMLRVTARKTWSFFDRTIGPPETWLPPDNLQVKPSRGIARRTSPTNMGMALLAVLAAHDLGYLASRRMLDRLEHMLGAMHNLDRCRGHFYNWYDTTDGTVLRPRYVSTVDSGNLLAALIVLREGLVELARDADGDQPSQSSLMSRGLQDTLMALQEEVDRFSVDIDVTDQEGILGIIRSLLADGTAGEKNSQTDLSGAVMELRTLTEPYAQNDESGDLAYWSAQPEAHVRAFLEEPVLSVPDIVLRANMLIDQCDGLMRHMEFGFLYDHGRNLFSIGFNEDRMALDKSTYDLLASEARVASFLAIARGDVPARHWFKLSRRLTDVDGGRALVSWGGTMFEYMMPLLFMKRYEHSLLDDTYDNVVRAQIAAGRQRGHPWGVSESGYNALNLNLDYQYRAFGIPDLGLKRGLAQDYVVAPYATMLAVGVDPDAAIRNLRQLRAQGAYGSMGYYEAVDYTRGGEEAGASGKGSGKESGRASGREPGIVFSYMAHHQGMGLLSVVNLLLDSRFQHRFHASPLVRSTELLLQERLPEVIELTSVHSISAEREASEESGVETAVAHVPRAELDGPTPRTLFLTNGRLHTCISAAGTGYTAVGQTQLTVFTPDRVADEDGLFIYVRDLDRGSFWSAGYQPVAREADRYDAWLHVNKFESARVDDWIETFMEVCVSPLDDVELRRITLTNYSDETRRLEVTSFAGVALLERRAFEEHPAFYKLFVQTEYLHQHRTLLAHRRPRRSKDRTIWMIHGLIEHDGNESSAPVRYETDRKAFLGRGGSPARPAAAAPRAPSDSDRAADQSAGALGSVLDPAVSLSCVVELEPGGHTQLTFTTGAAGDREKAIRLADQYDNPYAVDRAFNLAHAFGLIQLQNFDIRPDESLPIHRLAGALLYGHPDLRVDESVIARNRKKQSDLWTYGVSGDVPLLVAHIPDEDHIDTVRFLVRAHAFWRYRGLHVDLFLVNESEPSYMDDLGDLIGASVESAGYRGGEGPGVVVVRRRDSIPDDDMVLLHAAARVVIRGELPVFELMEAVRDAAKDRAEAAGRSVEADPGSGPNSAPGSALNPDHSKAAVPFGAFSDDGREFVIQLRGGADGPTLPPMPWSNVIANDLVGFLVTERGAGSTWSRNSRENRLTPWSNDPVSDPVEEAIYIRDDEAGEYWSPTAGPAFDSGDYEVRHGFGYTTFLHEHRGLREQLTRFVDAERPVKVSRLRLENDAPEDRRLTLFFYNRLVLGVLPERSGPFVVTAYDPDLHAIQARNTWNNEFADLVAGVALVAPAGSMIGMTTDRATFLGRNRRLSAPVAVCDGRPLDGRTGAGVDPCAAFSVEVVIPAGGSFECSLLIGESGSGEEFADRVVEFSRDGAVDEAFERVVKRWDTLLSRISVNTGSKGVDRLANGWLVYQNLGCRLIGRTAFYQSGGAFGFRDQLQDAAAMLAIDPARTRHQILVHAARQFREGDVQHWWHPPTGRGVRTRITDDLLWLPHVTADYVAWTGDAAVLDEQVTFIEGPLLEEDEHERYFTPMVTTDTASLLEHCCRAIDRSLTSGRHGFPLIGTGDWNDGMDRVGDEGHGESVWLGFFQYDILKQFIPLCTEAGEHERIRHYLEAIDRLEHAFDGPGWDGEWYRRAFYDDGTPLGTADADECRIDALAQAWAVLSGAAPDSRASAALESVDRHLVDEENGLIRLLSPPFDRTEQDPGYIKGYVPGVRENGGQYTHAALWVIQAFTRLGRGTRAVELLQLILPPNRAASLEGQLQYQVEPYAVAADIYGVPPHNGRGGWTWYTGSAGWMYRVIVESILGLGIEAGKRVVIRPCISARWDGYDVSWRPAGSGPTLEISVRNPAGVETGISSCTVDGRSVVTERERVVLPFDPALNVVRRIEVIMG